MKLLLILLLSIACFGQELSFDPPTTNWLYNARGAVQLFYENGKIWTVRGDSASGSLIVSPLYFEIGRDNVAGFDSQFKFGQNPSVGTSEEVIWDGGGNYTFLDTAETMTIVSTSDDDTLNGSGAWNLIVYGLDSDWKEVSEYIILDGTTPVITTNSFLRVFRAHIVNSGNPDPIGDGNLGNITITSTGSTTLQAQIGIGNGQTLMCVYTIPAGKTGYVTGLSFAVGQGRECTFFGKFRNGVNGAFSVKYSLTLYQSSFFGTLEVPLKIPEKVDMVITATATATPVKADASFGIILIDN
jgi:hypothetical protein